MVFPDLPADTEQIYPSTEVIMLSRSALHDHDR